MTKLFILDFGSGNTCKNDLDIIKDMIDQFAKVISGLDITKNDGLNGFIIKWQLFKGVRDNMPLKQTSFMYAYNYAEQLGLRTTASVFDQESLDFLLQYKVPFVKFASWLPHEHKLKMMQKVPDSIPIIKSYTDKIIMYIEDKPLMRVTYNLACIPAYPAKAKQYKGIFNYKDLQRGISDHTTTWALLKNFAPDIYECHYKLPNSTGLDAGQFARTPKQLKEVLHG